LKSSASAIDAHSAIKTATAARQYFTRRILPLSLSALQQINSSAQFVILHALRRTAQCD